MSAHTYNLSMKFERTRIWNFGLKTFTPRMLRLLYQIDKKATSIAELIELLPVSYEELYEDLQALHELKLIKLCLQTESKVSEDEKEKKPNLQETDISENKTHLKQQPKKQSKKAYFRGAPYYAS